MQRLLVPLWFGLSHPVNALTVGASVPEIVNMAAITVNQILDREASLASTKN